MTSPGRTVGPGMTTFVLVPGRRRPGLVLAPAGGRARAPRPRRGGGRAAHGRRDGRPGRLRRHGRRGGRATARPSSSSPSRWAGSPRRWSATRLPVELLVLVNAMIPLPGETGGEWWTVTGQGEARPRTGSGTGIAGDPDDDAVTYFHDVPADVAAAAHGAAVRPVGPAVRGPVAAGGAGPTSPPGSSPAATTGSSPRSSSGGSRPIGSGSPSTRCPAATWWR